MVKEIELYIHIPFCVRKCNYCDFLSFPAGEETRDRYVDVLCQEVWRTGKYIRSRGNDCEPGQEGSAGLSERSGYRVRSIFLGGGTPSLLDGPDIANILDSVRDAFDLLSDVEISMEANPGTLTYEKLKGYRRAGVNRLSMGLQTTDEACLKMLGRIHSLSDFLENYDQARRAGFDNVNIDIMSALPGQSRESYQRTLETVAALEPEHISSYSLILEEGTPFYRDESIIKRLPDEETDRQMYEMTKRLLEEAGYHRYEISNYAKEGRECIHNLGYWEDVPYLGLGLGASSYWKEEGPSGRGKYLRFRNQRNMKTYLETPFTPFGLREDYQELSPDERMSEFMFLGLRKIRGVEIGEFRQRFGRDMESVYGDSIRKFLGLGLLCMKEGRLALTDRGIDVSNQIFCEFV